MFSDISIKQRLMLGFGCILALMIILFGAVGSEFVKTRGVATEITRTLNPQVKAADSLASAVTRERTSLRGYALTGDQHYYADFRDAVADRHATANELLHVLTYKQDKKTLAAIQTQINELERYEPHVSGMLNAPNRNAAYDYHTKWIRPLAESIAAEASTLAKLGHERIDRATGILEAANTRLIRLAWIALISALLLSASIVAASVRAIAKKTESIASAAGAVADGNYDKAIALEKSSSTSQRYRAVPRDELRRIALAINEMAAGLKKREQNLRTQADISAVCASSVEVTQLLDRSLTELACRTDSQAAVVYIRDDEGLRVGTTYGITHEAADQALTDADGLVEQAASGCEPIILSSIPDDTRFLIKPGLGTVIPKSMACIPMVAESESIGVVVLASWNCYEPDTISLMETAVAQIAVALSNAIHHTQLRQLSEELEEKNDELDAQNESLQSQNEEIQVQNEELQAQNEEIQAQSEEIQSQNEELAGQRVELQQRTVELEAYTSDLITIQSINAVALASLDQDELLRGLLDTMSFAMDLDLGLIKLYDEDRNELRTLVTHHIKDPDLFARYIGHEFAHRVVEAKQLLSVEETQLASMLSHPYAIKAGIKSLIGIPLIASGQVIGAAIFGTSDHRTFSDGEKQLLQVFADRAAMSVARMRDYEKLASAEEHARNDHERLRAIIDNMPEGVVISDAPDGRIYVANKAALGLYGLETTIDVPANEQLEAYNLYRTTGEVFSWEDLPLNKSLFKGTMCTGEEILIRQPGGNEVIVLYNTTPIRDEHGNITSALGVFQDITEIKAQQRRLEEGYEHQRYIAETLQKSFLPGRPFSIRGYEIGDKYIPASKDSEVGGDFYDVIELDDDRICVVMADVSGKGVKAAVHTAMTKYILRAFVLENPEPAVVLQKLNNAVSRYITEDMFVTLFYGLLYTGEGRLVFANAGHERPLLYRADEGACVALDSTGPALGILPGKGYQQVEMHLGERDSLVLYTDGITEARHGDNFLGQEGLEEILCEISSSCAKDMTGEILVRVREFAHNELRDDVALLVIKACEAKQ